MLGVADASYSRWILRIDLHRIAMFGRGDMPAVVMKDAPPDPGTTQPDNVIVTPKKKNTKREGRE
jgi:hypothetical protein